MIWLIKDELKTKKVKMFQKQMILLEKHFRKSVSLQMKLLKHIKLSLIQTRNQMKCSMRQKNTSMNENSIQKILNRKTNNNEINDQIH